jgi:hypothetical protein
LGACNKGEQILSPSGYKLLVSKKPFFLLVSEKYPEDQSMMLLTEKHDTILSFDDTGEGTNRAVISAGNLITSSISLDRDGKPKEMIVMLSLPETEYQVLRDINLDGLWDIKMLPRVREHYVFENGQWSKVDTITGKWPEVVARREGQVIKFDYADGRWKVSADETESVRNGTNLSK